MNRKEEMNKEFCEILNLLEQISIMYNTEKNINKEYNITKEFLNLINEFISGWMKIIQNANVYFGQIEAYIEKMVEPVIGMEKVDINDFDEKFQRVYREIKIIQIKLGENIVKERAVIYGNSQYTIIFLCVKDTLKIQVEGVVLTQENEFNKSFFDKLQINTFQKFELPNINSDYLILCDNLKESEGLDEINGIQVEFSKFVCNYYMQSPEFICNFFENFKSLKGNYNGIITGISYMQWGVSVKKLKFPMALFANPSQDLFYDFKMFQYGYEKAGNPDVIKYAVVGLCLYSFEYDMSKSIATAGRTAYYYPIVGTMHHYKYKDISSIEYQVTQNVMNQILIDNFQEDMWHVIRTSILDSQNHSGHMEFNSEKLTEDEYAEIMKEATDVFSKNYNETVQENIKIFEDYMRFLYNRKINTLVIIPPFTAIYQSCIDEKMESQTLEIVNNFKQKYNFEFWNLSRSSDFEDIDFRDASHLNYKGAEKLTNRINEWCSQERFF